MCKFPTRNRADVEISEVSGNRGKLCYVCPACKVFRGWLLPLETGASLESVELDYCPDTSRISPSPLCYEAAHCRVRQCRGDALIKISSSTANPGKLYYYCPACKKFVSWCLPVNKEGESSISKFGDQLASRCDERSSGFLQMKRKLDQLFYLNILIVLMLLVVLIVVLW